MDPQVYFDITLPMLRQRVEEYHRAGWRFVNICGSTVEGDVELLYTFSRNEPLENLRLVVKNDARVPSITDLYFAAFFFENETHDLFGVSFEEIAIDFVGAFYQTSVPTPMNPASQQAQAALGLGSRVLDEVNFENLDAMEDEASAPTVPTAPTVAPTASTTPNASTAPTGEPVLTEEAPVSQEGNDI